VIHALSPNGDVSKDEYVVSKSGGTSTPMWRGDGEELFYLKGRTLMAVEIKRAAKGLSVGPTRTLFNVDIELEERRNRYVVTRDGQRFLVIVKDKAN